MGNLEKLVVLTVIFLSGIVLAVSLNSTSEVNEVGDTPLDNIARRAEQQFAAGPEDGVPGANSAGGGGESESPAASSQADGPALLSADVNRESVSGSDSSAKGVLKRVEGISNTVFDDVALYTCTGTETFTSLARDLYGSVEYAGVIRAYNEGQEVLASGDELLVPLDARPVPARDRALEARPVREAPRTANIIAPEPIEPDRELGSTAVTHTIAEGESLSSIAAQYYGKEWLWRRIYDHNRDVIESPDRVRTGTVIEIP